MDKLDLIKIGVIEPWEQLNQRLAEQKVVETEGSDEAGDAGRLAAEIINLADDFKLDGADLASRSAEWLLVSAVAEAGRKRLLSSAARRTALVATSHFEADDNGEYRFINTRLMIVHPTGDKADFLVTAAKAIKSLSAHAGLDTDWPATICEGPAVFTPAVVLDAGPDPNRVIKALQLRFYRRNVNGELVMFEPQNWQLELKTATK